MGTVRVLCWRSLAMLFVLLGMIGVVVPGMPTVVFLLLAAWAGSHGWPQLERWLLQHPRHGGHIRQWREHGAIPRRAKCAASTMMLISIALISLSSAPDYVKIGVPLLLCGVLLGMWRRPEPIE